MAATGRHCIGIGPIVACAGDMTPPKGRTGGREDAGATESPCDPNGMCADRSGGKRVRPKRMSRKHGGRRAPADESGGVAGRPAIRGRARVITMP